jgi:hypothetical protein
MEVKRQEGQYREEETERRDGGRDIGKRQRGDT